MDRRDFLRQVAAATGGVLLASDPVRATASRAAAALGPLPSHGPYGPLGPANTDGIQLPAGFSSRLIAVSGQAVAGTKHIWHFSPDGGACATRPEGGWVYVSNCELTGGLGGVTAIAFDPVGNVVDAYTILSGTSRSCSGGMTPWGTYLSGEENGAHGGAFECNPFSPSQGVHRPLLGRFAHEMMAVDPTNGAVYMVEDTVDGRLYRFLPDEAGDLTHGSLCAASVVNGVVSWLPTSTSGPDRAANTTVFKGGEGAWIHKGSLFFTTKLDTRIWRLELGTRQLSVFYDGLATPGTTLTAVDNLIAHTASGDLFVAEDGGNMEVGLVTTVGTGEVAPFLRFVGHDASEVAGIAFTPAGDRLYVTSQRGTDGVAGRTYEISGPFRRRARRRMGDPRVPSAQRLARKLLGQ